MLRGLFTQQLKGPMYKVTLQQKNWVLFIFALSAAIAAVSYVPHTYAEQMVEIPVMALYIGQAGLALLLTLLCYENASISESIKLAACMFGIALAVGAAGNFFGQTTQFLPESIVLINWVQLLIMTLSGLIATLTLFKLVKPEAQRVQSLRPFAPSVAHESPPVVRTDDSPEMVSETLESVGDKPIEGKQESPPWTESVKDILERLDISRINRLERSLRPEKVTLESLFKEESQAAHKANSSSNADTKAPQAPVDTPAQPAEHRAITSSKGRDLPAVVSRSGTADKDTDQAQDFAPPVLTGETLIDERASSFGAFVRELTQEINAEGRTAEGTDLKAAEDGISSFQQLLQGQPQRNLKAEPVPSVEAQDGQKLEQPSDNMLGDVGSEIEDIFSKMIPNSAQTDCSAEALLKLRKKESSSELASSRPEIASEPLPLNPVSSTSKSPRLAIDSTIIEHRSEIQQRKSAAELEARMTQESLPPAQAKEVKEFGRLSAGSGAQAQQDPTSAGTMKTIGKMLLDAQAVENIIREAEKSGCFRITTARVISIAEGKDIESLLVRINKFPGIEGSVIVGEDGLVVAAQVSCEMDKEVLGAMSLAIHANTNLVTQKVELGKLRQIVLQSRDKITILTALDKGVLGVYTRRRKLDHLNHLLAAIVKVIEGNEPDLESINADISDCESGTVECAPVDSPVLEEDHPTAVPADIPVAQEVVADQESAIVGGAASETTDVLETSVAHNPVAANMVKDLIDSLAKSQDTSVLKEEPCGISALNEEQTEPDEKAAAEVIAEILLESSNQESVEPTVAVDGLTAIMKEAGEGQGRSDETAGSGMPALPTIKAKEVKEFGRLASGAAPKSESQSEGTMKSIGKMLIDVQAVGNIIKAGESNKSRRLTTARVISAARGEGIRSLLGKIDNFPGVMGSLIVGHDGLVIASTVDSTLDKDLLGAMASAIHSNTNLATNKLELGNLRQTILQSPDKVTVFTDVEVGVLAVFTQHRELDQLDNLLAAIENTIRG